MQGQQHGTIIIGLQQTSKTIYVSCDTSNSCNFSIKKQHKCSLNKKAKSVSISLPNLRWGNKFDNINEVSYPLTRTFIIDIHCIQVKLEVFFVGPLFLTSFSLSHFALLCLIWRSSSEIELQSNFWGGRDFGGSSPMPCPPCSSSSCSHRGNFEGCCARRIQMENGIGCAEGGRRATSGTDRPR